MTRREWAKLCLAIAAEKGFAQGLESYPGLQYPDYSRVWPDYLENLAKTFYEQRFAEISSLQYINKIFIRQKDIRRTIWRLIGGAPVGGDLAARTTGSLERTGYRVDKIFFQSSPDLWVTGNLYLPNAKGRHPAVLFQCGHAALGKAYPEYQRCCQALAQLGFVVLVFDPIGQGERVCYPGADGRLTRLGDPIYEHIRIGQQLLLWGETVTRLQLWDAIRALDLLTSHPAVDPRRIGITGHSGGGTMTMWLAAVDERPAAAVLCCAATENFLSSDFKAPGPINDAEQNPIGAAPLGLDRWDLLLPFAPKPLSILLSASDNGSTYSPGYIANGWEEFKALRASYALMNAAGDLAWSDTALPHPLGLSLRTGVYSWFSRHLHSEAIPVKDEPPTSPEDERDLWAAPEGRVLSMRGTKTPLAIRRSIPISDHLEWTSLLKVERPPAVVETTVLRRTPETGYVIDAIQIQGASKIPLPAWLVRPHEPRSSAPLVVLLDSRGRHSESSEDGLIAGLARKGIPVIAPDLRGAGSLAPAISGGPPGFARWRERDDVYAWCSLALGQTVVGQQVTDLLWVLRAADGLPEFKALRIIVCARGTLTTAAILATPFLEKRVSMALHGGLISIQSLSDADDPAHPFASFVPGALQCRDFPALCSGIELTLAGMTAGDSKIAPVAMVRDLYSGARLLGTSESDRWMLEEHL